MERIVSEYPNSFFDVLKSHFRDFAIFEVRDFRRPIRLLLLEIRWGVGEWSSRGRQAELGELSMLWDIATSPPIDPVGQGAEIPAEL